MLSAYTTKFDSARDEFAERLTPERLDAQAAHEQTWRGASEWEIREAMEAAVLRSRSQSHIVRRAIVRTRRMGGAA